MLFAGFNPVPNTYLATVDQARGFDFQHMSSTIPLPPRDQHIRYCSNKHTHQSGVRPVWGTGLGVKCQTGGPVRSGWTGGPVKKKGGLVVGSCTSHPGVLGSIPKREEPGKTGRHPVLKYRVPHGSQINSARGALEEIKSAVMGSTGGEKVGSDLFFVSARTNKSHHHQRHHHRGAGGCGLLADTRQLLASEDSVPPSLLIPTHTHILLARSPAPYSPFRRRPHSPTVFSGQMACQPPSPPRPPPSHVHAGWMVSATRTPTSSAPSQDYLFPLYM